MNHVYKYLRHLFMFLFGTSYFLAVASLTFLDFWQKYYHYFFLGGSVFLVLLFLVVIMGKDKEQPEGNAMIKYIRDRRKLKREL